MVEPTAERRQFLRYVMLAVLVWGSLIALGTMLFGFDQRTGAVHFSPNLWRGLIVEACVLGFLGIWWWLVRRSR